MRGIIVGNTYEKAAKKLDRMIKDYQNFWNIKPQTIMKNKLQYKVLFENNDVWEILSTNSNARGHKCNILLVDIDIPEEIVWELRSNIIYIPYGGISYY